MKSIYQWDDPESLFCDSTGEKTWQEDKQVVIEASPHCPSNIVWAEQSLQNGLIVIKWQMKNDFEYFWVALLLNSKSTCVLSRFIIKIACRYDKLPAVNPVGSDQGFTASHLTEIYLFIYLFSYIFMTRISFLLDQSHIAIFSDLLTDLPLPPFRIDFSKKLFVFPF